MQSYADRRFATVAFGLLEGFWLPPLAAQDSSRWSALGLEDFAARYFAVRSAPLGGGPADLVTAAFFGFHPSKVERYVPAVWERTSPDEALAALTNAADEVLTAALGGWVRSADAREAATLLREAVEARRAGIAGRPLFAGYCALPWPDPDRHHLTIWHASTLLREFRGDSHIAVLVANGVDSCECHLLLAAAAVGGCECHAPFVALGARPDVTRPPNPAAVTDREWPIADRKRALQRLVDRGLLTPQATITPAGAAFHEQIELVTDRVSAAPGTAEDVDRLRALLSQPVLQLRASANIAGVVNRDAP